MKTAVYGENNSSDILFLSGWGNRIGDPNIGWLIDLLVNDGYKVHVFEFPGNIKDFNREYLEPVKAYQEALGPHVILSHSLGGLVAAYCSAQTKSVYLSPWWDCMEVS
jgi:pimeloyl-ACP methyl ester carboxylesterase